MRLSGAGRMLRHRGIVARGAVSALSAAGAEAGWLRSATTWLDSIIGAAARRLPRDAAAPRAAGPALERRWPGPANLRALAEAARPPDRDWLTDQLAADRGGNYARAVALMHAVNGERDRQEVTWWAALSSELPMRGAFADRFLDLLAAAGWTSCGDRR
jgi:hypothetical protein